MADKQIMNLLNKMLEQMNPQQKQKLNSILQDEDSIRKALSSVDPNQAKKVAKDLNLESQISGDAGEFVEQLKNYPDLIKKMDKKPF